MSNRRRPVELSGVNMQCTTETGEVVAGPIEVWISCLINSLSGEAREKVYREVKAAHETSIVLGRLT